MYKGRECFQKCLVIFRENFLRSFPSLVFSFAETGYCLRQRNFPCAGFFANKFCLSLLSLLKGFHCPEIPHSFFCKQFFSLSSCWCAAIACAWFHMSQGMCGEKLVFCYFFSKDTRNRHTAEQGMNLMKKVIEFLEILLIDVYLFRFK